MHHVLPNTDKEKPMYANQVHPDGRLSSAPQGARGLTTGMAVLNA